MNPEERQLLERSLKLSEENHTILKKMDRRARRATIYGFIRLAIILIPFVIGYFLLEPYIGEIQDGYRSAQDLLNALPR